MSNAKETNTVELSPSGKRFSVMADSSLLESGLSCGVALPYSCANGSCGDCRARIVSGNVRKIHFHDFALTEAEKLDGVCLLCANTADTDLIIEVTEASSAQDIPLQTLRGKVCHVEHLADVAIVRFKLSRGKALRYLPGQYATITTAGNTSLMLPIANCPCEPDYLEFHVPQLPAANQTDRIDNNQSQSSLLSGSAIRQRVTIEGPHGFFTVDQQRHDMPDSPAPICFIATAAGFASVKPLAEHVMTRDDEPPCTLIWIASDSISHYHHNLCRSWSDAFDNISYRPLNHIDQFSEAAVREWGLVHSGAAVYISGDSDLNSVVTSVLLAAGVSRQSIFTDTTLSDTTL